MKKIFTLVLVILFVGILNADPPEWSPLQGTQYSMVVMATITLYDQPFENTGNNMAAAFGPGGEEDCRAVATWQEANPPYYDGFWFFTIVANTQGELISFKIYNEATDNIYNCDGSVVFANNTTIGSPSEPYQLSVGTGSLSGNVFLVTTTPPEGDISNLTISVAGQSTHPDENGYYSFELDTGIYNLTYELEGYLTTTLKNVQVNAGTPTENVNTYLVDWEPIGGTQYSMVVMTTASYNGTILDDNSTFEIAAFGPEGDGDCRGIAYWQEANPPYWDGYWYITIVGNTIGEPITFKFFNETNGEIIDCYQTVTFEDNTTIGSAEAPYQISNGAISTYNFSQGWNWVSFNIQPQQTSVDSFFFQVTGIYQVKNQYHSATYFSQQNLWVGDLQSIDFTKTYLIFMLDSFNNFSISGIPVSPATPIPLDTGWNWISYLPKNQKSLEDALNSIENNVYQIKSQNHSATYYNPPGNWVGDLDTMYPKQGYKIKVTAPDTLVYEEDKNSGKSFTKDTEKDSPEWQVITGTEYSMVLMARVTHNGQSFTGDNQDNMVAAFGPGGESDCRSIAVWQPPIQDWDGYWYFTIVGDIQNEPITFKIYDAETDQVYNCLDTLEFHINDTYGSPDNPVQLTTAQNSTQDNQIQEPNYNVEIYPNPFVQNCSKNSGIKIKLNIPKNSKAKLVIYNLKGQKVYGFSNLSSEDKTLYWKTIDSNGKKLPSGIYLYRLVGDSFDLTKKLTIIK